ncbi:DUF3131 domain-containing protein [Falsihalocynthiibacter sp. CO-5D18]|uniref:DUF3131 domain-containing protein n=1 Tax=Falsihalocynthiibacter sp. CO-5D18 TaxID=3240872 RepID=UPI00350F3A95
MLNRRNFMASAGVSIVPSFRVGTGAHAQDVAHSVTICLVGVSETTSSHLVELLAKLFMSRGLPICCALDFSEGRGFDSTVGRLVETLAQTEAGLFEVAAQMPRRASDRRYFQMRTAAKLRANLTTGPSDSPLHVLGSNVTTLYDPFPDDDLDHAAFRGSGFRVFLQPFISEKAPDINAMGREQIVVSGGTFFKFSASDARASGTSASEDTVAGGLICIPVDVASKLPEKDVVEQLTALAMKLADANNSGRFFISRPTDLLLQTDAYPASSLSLALIENKTPLSNDALDAFEQELTAASIPFTRFDKDAFSPCPATASHEIQTKCIHFTQGDSAPLSADTRIILLPPETPNAYFGLRPDGRYQIASHGAPDMPAQTLLPLNPVADMTIVITPENVSTYIKRASLIHRLTTMRHEGRAKLRSVSGMVDYLFASEPILSNLQSTRRLLATLPPTVAPPVAEERKKLLQDAALAWQYIERYSHSTTGLCAGTAKGGSGGRVNRDATMWDIASQLRGIMSACSLGIIDRKNATERVETVLANLPPVTIDGARLPPARLSTETGRGISEDFDACDAGRFLVALFAVKQDGLAAPETVQRILDGWDLNRIVRDGHPYDYINGKLVDKYLSHCTQYSRLGYAMAGQEIDSPYADDRQGSKTEQQINFLYTAASIGHFGTEPALLQEIELGKDEPTAYLARVLFDAQLRWYEKTGTLKCASETLLDFSPWFSYQGVRFDRDLDESWVVAFTSSSSKFQTPAFRRKAEVISSKSAYLWAATVPHPYSQKLVAFIRDKARIEGQGFSAGIFAQDHKPMYLYSDVNTNGIILTAIAHMLRDEVQNKGAISARRPERRSR